MRTLVLFLLLALPCAAAWLAPEPFQGTDYATVPPEASSVHAALEHNATSLAKACEIAAQAGGGLAHSAGPKPGDPGCLRVEVYSATQHRRVEVKIADGSVASNVIVPRFPGEPVQGEPTMLPSGLGYWDILQGSGPAPAGPTSTVRVVYTGWFVDGTRFESSLDTGKPAEFVLGSALKGWAEGLSTMKVGGKRKLLVPYPLGFGERGFRSIPARATLIFDFELLEILPESAQPPQPLRPK